MSKVLIVEDEKDIRDVLAFNLRGSGHEIRAAASAAEALRMARTDLPDVVVLDVMLPDASGFDVCRQLKRDPKTARIPIVMLTARAEEVDRIVGFELGADDYVVKPFSMRELLLRLAAVVRRGAAEPPEGPLGSGRLRIDTAAHRAFVGERELGLTAMEFRLLVMLVRNQDRVLTRGRLLEEVWGMRPDVSTRTVDTHVKRLREKLGSPEGDAIETVRGVGYRWAKAGARRELSA
jgi:two-component system phosphate regulon response regulator PhoB